MSNWLREDLLKFSLGQYRSFIDRCQVSNKRFGLTPRAEPTPYALCFAIFGLHLLKDSSTLALHKDIWDATLRQDLDRFREQRKNFVELQYDKPYLQLLTFTLSALEILGSLENNPLMGHVVPLLPTDVKKELEHAGVFAGAARSGNFSMFMAILFLHARKYLGIDTELAIKEWVSLHLEEMNRFGFWGGDSSMSHLQFQNGYHQYEILEFLDVNFPKAGKASDNVAGLADEKGHFAPYPGGGGCYDYDAIFVITAAGNEAVERHHSLLVKTAHSILKEQNDDGGFAESLYIRPRSLANLKCCARHIVAAKGKSRRERLRYCLSLLRTKHDRIHTHWSKYSREWGESDLWDSWFRMLTIARIQVAIDPGVARNWGFINYPGIGYHPSCRLSL